MTATSSPQLHAVVLVNVDEDFHGLQSLDTARPAYVRLWRHTAPEAVALVIGTLVTWGRENAEWSVEALSRNFPEDVPGGFAAVDQGALIAPSCCCGLATWREWLKVRATADSPWMGHDPAPFVEVQPDRICVWADGGLGDDSRGGSPIVFSPSEFDEAVLQATTDLSEFENPLREWLCRYAPDHAESIARQYRERFAVGIA